LRSESHLLRSDGADEDPATACGRQDPVITIIVGLYNALEEAGASDEKARAAPAWPDCDRPLSKTEANLLV
jgi:hypothetical protein